MFLRFQTVIYLTDLAPAFIDAGMHVGGSVEAIHNYWVGA